MAMFERPTRVDAPGHPRARAPRTHRRWPQGWRWATAGAGLLGLALGFALPGGQAVAQAPGLPDNALPTPPPVSPEPAPRPPTTPAPTPSAQPGAQRTLDGVPYNGDEPPHPGEMSSAEVDAYFAELREWHRHRYDHPFTALLSVGFGFPFGDHDVDAVGPGFGLSIGYTIPLYDTYLGVRGAHYLGQDLAASSNAVQTDGLTAGAYSTSCLALEVGREVMYQYARFRLSAAAGAMLAQGPDDDDLAGTLGVSGSVLFPLGVLMVGVQPRIDWALGRNGQAAHVFGLHALAGLRL